MSRFELVDERAAVTLRARIGALLSDAESADFAVTRIRLAAIDLSPRELAGVASCRVLLGQLDAAMLADTAEAGAGTETAGAQARAERLAVLLGFARGGRLRIRSAGVGGWTPDFSVVRGCGHAVVLVGAHYFGNPYPTIGPSFTAITEDAAAVRLAGERFEELWTAAHDVLPAVGDVLERAHALALAAARGAGGADPPGPVR